MATPKGKPAPRTAAEPKSGAAPAAPAPAPTTPAPAPPAPATPAPAAPARKDAPRTMRDLRLATESRRRAPVSRPAENPLREGLRLERVPDPSAFVLFGATGDLANRKVVPALFQLWRTHLLPHEFTIVAVGRRPYTDQAFRDELKASLDMHSRVQPVDT
jgi:glucose-6-phosphate 1-dehydrogenase